MPGSARSCSQIPSRNGSSFDTAGDRAYLGGDSAANARRIVLRCSPVRLLISRIDNRCTPRMRLTSAHCSTPTTPSSSPDHRDQARVRTRPDEPTPRQVGHFWTGAGGPLFTRRPHGGLWSTCSVPAANEKAAVRVREPALLAAGLWATGNGTAQADRLREEETQHRRG